MKIGRKTKELVSKIRSEENLGDVPVYHISETLNESVLANYDKLSALGKSLDDEDKKEVASKMNGIYIHSHGITTFKDDGINAYTKSGFEVPENMVMHALKPLIFWTLFRLYAEVEVKALAPKTKLKDIKCKYVNDTPFPITFLDSTWFTTLVKSDAFKVSGHFRLQPCHDENGKPTKKLIWISDYMKTGYTSPAKKLSL